MHRRLLARLTVVSALTAALLCNAAPALAAPSCCTVSITSVPSEYQLGGAPGEVSTTITTPTGSPAVGGVVRLLAVRLDGLSPGQVRVDRRGVGGAWNPLPLEVGNRGTVRARDDSAASSPLAPGDSLTGQYRLTFEPGAPAGAATLALTSYIQKGGDHWRAAGADQAGTVTVAAPDAQPSTGPAGATPPASAPGASRSASASVAPSAAAAASAGPSAAASNGTEFDDLAAGAPSELAPISGDGRPAAGRPVSADRQAGQVASLAGAVVLLAAIAATLLGRRRRRRRRLATAEPATGARSLGEQVREAFGPQALGPADRHHAAPTADDPQSLRPHSTSGS